MVRDKCDQTTGIRYLERAGSGDAVVFLHGIGSSAASFRGLFDLMPPALRLIAWNAPGYGGSAALPEVWPLAARYAAVLHRFLTSIDAQRAVLVGHSLGTLIAAAYARSYPEQVPRIVLAAAACGYGLPTGAPLPRKLAERIADLHRQGPAAFARARAPRLVHDPQANPGLVRQVETAMAAIHPAGYAQAVHMLASGDLVAALRGVRCPVGFIIGAQDAVTPPEQTHRAANAVEAAQGHAPPVVQIDGAGHAVYLQRPHAFAEALISLTATHGTAHPAPTATGGTHA